jgi:monoamine oxidase
LKPGQYSQFHGYESVRIGNIHFAGDSTSSEFSRFMEGATEEGQRAAQ